MEEKIIEKEDYTGSKVKVLDATYDPGTPEKKGVGDEPGWRGHFGGREQMIKYLKNGERYWYGTDWYGSEKKR
ncbi:MAG: hypothetical protein JW807_07335 [Spirochaetes bacterium]|nr:hypothetical protein [Spirochaetota bacterium]